MLIIKKIKPGLLFMMAAALALNGCGLKTDSGSVEKTVVEEEKTTELLTDADILSAKCSHEILTHQCDECRYEIGVVKLDASLIGGQPAAGGRLVETATTEKKIMAAPINITGEIRLNENTTVHISPRIGGILSAVNMNIGANVKTGEILFEIESVELGQALCDYKKNQALAALSRKNYEREKALFEQKIGAEAEMIAARMTLEEHESGLKAAEQKLHVVGLTEADIAALDSENHSVLRGTLPMRAPISGAIIEKHAVVGELVEAGRDVMLLADLDTLWIMGDIYESDLALLLRKKAHGGIPIEAFVRAWPEKMFSGIVDYIGATMDESTRTVKVRATIDNREGLLKPGMFCEAKIRLNSGKEVLAVPKIALLTDEGKDFVFTRLKDDYYVRRPVKKGREFQESVEILEGLALGQTIVTKGAFLLKSDVLREKMGAGCAD